LNDGTYHQGSTMLKSKFARLSALFQITLVGLSALFQIALAGLMLTAIAACSSLGQQAPKSPEDTLQYAKATLSGVYRTIGDAAAARAISSDQGRQLMGLAATADESLVEATALMATGTSVDTQTALGKVQVALAVLQQVSTVLKNVSKPVAPPAAAPPASAASAG
jgi:hypothetical protein